MGLTASDRRRERLEVARAEAQRDARRGLSREAATVRGCPAIVDQPCPTCQVGELRQRGDGVVVCAMCGVNQMLGALDSSTRLKRRLMADAMGEWTGSQ